MWELRLTKLQTTFQLKGGQETQSGKGIGIRVLVNCLI